MMKTTDFKQIQEVLKRKSYKMTPQRQVILQAFLDFPEEHLSAEDVLAIVRKQVESLGLATVYRTLELFSDLGVLHKMDFGDGRSRYEMNSFQDDHYHHHLVCLECNTVKEFDDDLLDAVEEAITKQEGFKIVDHQLKLFGYCSNCQKKMSGTNGK
jgi:Fe2+/Zn2+ uptake regulation proteins